MALERLCLWRRELFAVSAEKFGNESRLFGRTKRLDEEFLPVKPGMCSIEYFAYKARGYEADSGRQCHREPTQVSAVGELVEAVEDDQDCAIRPLRPHAGDREPLGEVVQLLVRITFRLELLARETGKLLHEPHNESYRIGRVSSAAEVVHDHRRLGVCRLPAGEPVGKKCALAAARLACHENRPRCVGGEFVVKCLEVTLATEIEPLS